MREVSGEFRVSWKFQKCFMKVLGCLIKVSRLFKECFNGALKKSQGLFEQVLKKFQGLDVISWTFPGCF